MDCTNLRAGRKATPAATFFHFVWVLAQTLRLYAYLSSLAHWPRFAFPFIDPDVLDRRPRRRVPSQSGGAQKGSSRRCSRGYRWCKGRIWPKSGPRPMARWIRGGVQGEAEACQRGRMSSGARCRQLAMGARFLRARGDGRRGARGKRGGDEAGEEGFWWR